MALWDRDLDPESPAYNLASSDNNITRSLAGPGTGKTFSLIRRIAYLMEIGGVAPEKILVLTFTRAAAGDFRKELRNLEIFGAANIDSRTLHSYCLRILLRRDVIDSINRYARPMLKHEKKIMLNDINVGESLGTLKERNKLLIDYESAWAKLQFMEPGFTQDPINIEFMNRIQDWMKFHESMTLGEIVPFTVNFLRNNPEFNDFGGYSHILVDEYQDLNKAEQVIIDRIANNSKLIIVGDENQSIYGFKNARPDGIRLFKDTHSGCVDINFQECRRCPQKVVHIADDLIKNDPSHELNEETILVPYPDNADGEVVLVQWKSLDEEITGISEIIKHILKNNSESLVNEDILVLSPRRKIARRINQKLLDLNIESQLVSNNYELIFENDLAKDIFAFISYLANMEDYVSLRYLLHKGSNWYHATYMKIFNYAKNNRESVHDVLNRIVSGEKIIPRITPNSPIIQRYVEITQLREKFEEFDSIIEFKNQIDDLIGGEAENIRQRISSIGNEFEYDATNPTPLVIQLSKLIKNNISNIVYAEEEEIEGGKVRVITCFSAKGLKGKVVIIGSCVDGLLPSLGEDDDLDEQRRLFYVAITRCEFTKKGFEGLLIISSFTNISNGEKKNLKIEVDYPGVQFSRFLEEIAPSNLPRVVSGTQLLLNLSI